MFGCVRTRLRLCALRPLIRPPCSRRTAAPIPPEESAASSLRKGLADGGADDGTDRIRRYMARILNADEERKSRIYIMDSSYNKAEMPAI